MIGLDRIRSTSTTEDAAAPSLLQLSLTRFRCHSEGDGVSISSSNTNSNDDSDKRSPFSTTTSSSFQFSPGRQRGRKVRNKLLAPTYTSFDEIALETDERDVLARPNWIRSTQRLGSLDSGLGSSRSTSLSSTTGLGKEGAITSSNLDNSEIFPRRLFSLPNWDLIDRKIGERVHWRTRSDFIVASLSYNVTLRTLIEFPLLAANNGGGAFLLAYFSIFLPVGIPLLILQGALGQYAQRGIVQTWKIAPIFLGIGTTMITLIFINGIIESGLAAFAFLYFLGSFLKELPWSICDGDWNRLTDCEPFDDVKSIVVSNSCLSISPSCPQSENRIHSTSLLFWRNFNSFENEESFLIPRWEMVASLAFIWICILLFTIKSFKSVIRILYPITITAAILFGALLARTVLMENAISGIVQTLNPDWDKLLELGLWKKAGELVVSVTGSGGIYLFLGSRNRFSSAIHIESTIMALGHSLVSISACAVVFAFFSVNPNTIHFKNLDYVSFAFVVPNEIFRSVPLTRIWCILFYCLLILCQLGTVLTNVEAIVTTLEDYDETIFIKLKRKRRILKTCVISVISFALSLFFATTSGLDIYLLLSECVRGFPEIFVSLLMVIIVMFVFGYKKFGTCLESMVRTNWKVFYGNWVFLCPIILMALLILHRYEFDFKDSFIPIVLPVFILIQIPAYACYKLFRSCHRSGLSSSSSSWKKDFLTPSSDWGPRSVPKITMGSAIPTAGCTVLFAKHNNDSFKEDLRFNQFQHY